MWHLIEVFLPLVMQMSVFHANKAFNLESERGRACERDYDITETAQYQASSSIMGRADKCVSSSPCLPSTEFCFAQVRGRVLH